MTEAATQTRFRIDGMDCAGCATKLDTAVRRLPGVADVMASVTAGTMAVSQLGHMRRDSSRERRKSCGAQLN
jgi:Zn2+/Cd2+-exporting ATPase